MPELIQALNPTIFPKAPPKKHRGDKPASDFARWLTGEKFSNEDEAFLVDFPVPLMSAAGILILAQAHEEEYALLARDYDDLVVDTHFRQVQAYQDAKAAQAPGDADDEGQYLFDFFMPGDHAGDVMDREI